VAADRTQSRDLWFVPEPQIPPLGLPPQQAQNRRLLGAPVKPSGRDDKMSNG
jgi:hypothetical protein